MQAEPQKNVYAAELGSRGGQKRMEQLNAAERSALAICFQDDYAA